MRLFILTLMLVIMFLPMSICSGEITIVPKADIEVQFNKGYEGDFAGFGLNADVESQSYTIGADITMGSLTLTPDIGVWDSKIKISDVVELDNEVGFTTGLTAKYDIYKPTKDLTLSLVGAYDYKHSEIDNITINPWGINLNNPIRNDVTMFSYEVGPRVTYSGLPINITPYLGIVLSDSSLNIDTELPNLAGLDMSAEENIGLRLGFSGQPIDNLTLGLDVKLIDEEAVAFRAAYAF